MLPVRTPHDAIDGAEIVGSRLAAPITATHARNDHGIPANPRRRDWLEGLSTAPFARAAFYIDLLAEHGPLLDEPYTRQLDGHLRELRFHIGRGATRITYWIASGRRIILLTVFTKTRMREDRQVDRARRALARCIAAQHDTHEED